MQIFVRSLDGSSHSFILDRRSVNPLFKLKSSIQDKLGLAVEDQRLYWCGRVLNDDRLIDLPKGSNLELSARLLGGEKKKRCQFNLGPTERCSNAALNIVGDCSKCNAKFCARHRLPEDHECPELDTFRKSAFLENKAKLESEAAAAGQNLHNTA